MGKDNAVVPPRDTDPPPLNPVPAVTDSEELARFALVMPAEPERLELVRPAIVVGVTAVTLPCASVVKTGMFKTVP